MEVGASMDVTSKNTLKPGPKVTTERADAATKKNELHIPTNTKRNTSIYTEHAHGPGAVQTPSHDDAASSLPTFVRGGTTLYITPLPGQTNTYGIVDLGKVCKQ
jgi:hypothetical protein